MNSMRKVLMMAPLLLTTTLAQAATSVSVELGLGAAAAADARDCTAHCSTSVSRSVFPPALSYFVSGDASASADLGTLKAAATTTALGVHTGPILTGAKAAAGFLDFFTINGGALNGTLGTLTVPLRFSWGATATSSGGGVGLLGLADFSVLLDPNIGTGKIKSIAFHEEFNGSGSLGGSGLITTGFSTFTHIPFTNTPTFSLDFMFGQPIKVKGDLKITIGGNDFNVGPGGTALIADFLVQLDAGHSAYWGGLQSVVDANGQPVPYTVSSASGHDWSLSSVPAPVPLPASAMLLLSGLGCLARTAQRCAARSWQRR